MRRILAYLLLLSCVCSCRFVSSILHDEDVVAEVGDAKLYVSELEKYIPNGVGAEDSLKLAAQYINLWATEQLYLKVAREQLSAEEMDVSAELENYRKSLIKYRYEQRYINDRLDTLVTDDQIGAYYDAHKSDFTLSRPILKVRFAEIMKNSPSRDRTIAMLKTDTLSSSSALRWFDSSDTWMDADELAREFDVDCAQMLSSMRGDYIRVEPAGRGTVMVAYVVDMVRSGAAPVDYCAETIKEKILSVRKHDLAKGLEQDLLADAREKNIFVIHQ